MFNNIRREKSGLKPDQILTMKDFVKNSQYQQKREEGRRNAWKKIAAIALIFFFAAILWYGLRTNAALEKISTKENSFWEKIIRILPIDKSFFLYLPLEKSIFEEPNTPSKRINFLILGIRGENDPSGGLLTDTSIILSIKPYDNKIALISLPRDLFVEMPGTGEKRKLNEAYEIGRKKNHLQELDYVKSVVSNISGITIHYVVLINFEGFKDLIDSLGGIELNFEKPFVEPVPFEEGSISLPQGKQILDGKTALLYTRARMSTSDFDRSRRQEDVIKAIYAKLTKTGLLLNPYRLNKILGVIENNVKTDMRVWEIEEMIKILARAERPKIITRVIDSGPEKLLYSEYTSDGAFVLLPTNGDYKKIQEVIRNIFD